MVVFDAELTANHPVKSIAFSAMSGTRVDKLLDEVHLTQVDGFKAAPLTQAAGQRLCHWHSEPARMSHAHIVLLTWL